MTTNKDTLSRNPKNSQDSGIVHNKGKEQYVTIRLPKTRELQEDVFVSVNQRSWLIRRGETVEVPLSVAEVLQHSEDMAQEALAFDSRVRRVQ